MNSMCISGRVIGPAEPPYIIAELSANHNGRLETALSIIDAAVEAGVDAIKLQTYRPETITLDSDGEEFRVRGGLWHGRTLFDLYQEAHLPWEWHGPLFERARQRGVAIFSSPFDRTAVDLLEDLGAPAYKIASFEAVDLPLIRYAAGTGKPMIISTGMADAEEIEEAIAAARDGGCRELAILHCVSGYPAPAADYNLHTIPDMRRRFNVLTGLSDHTLDCTTAICSIALGATIIEKHMTLRRSDGGPDSAFSIEPAEMAALCKGARMAWEALGRIDYGRKSSELGNVQFRRSLYFVRPMVAGQIVSEDDVRSVRPGFGLAPKYFDAVIGRKMKHLRPQNSPVRFEDLD
jgi:pseudaminic acid synthase